MARTVCALQWVRTGRELRRLADSVHATGNEPSATMTTTATVTAADQAPTSTSIAGASVPVSFGRALVVGVSWVFGATGWTILRVRGPVRGMGPEMVGPARQRIRRMWTD